MIQRILEDDDGNYAIEFDDEGIEFMIDGLQELLEEEVGGVMSTPTVWTKPAPWWRFWNRKGEPLVGDFRLRKVA